MRRFVSLLVAVVLPACATPGHVRRVEDQVTLLRAEHARQDSARAAQLTQIIALQQRLADSLRGVRGQLATVKGELANDLYGMQQQLLQLQELTGQSQRRLSELRADLDARAAQIAQQRLAPAPTDTVSAGGQPPSGAPSATQIYEASLQQLRRGSMSTARQGLQELLRTYPQHELTPDALYFIGQSFAAETPDSAVHYYRLVAREHPRSNRAPAALYNLGLLAERAKDVAAARTAYTQLVTQYPRADEANLARDRLKAIGR